MLDPIGSFLAQGGFIMFPLYAATLAVIGYAATAIVRLRTRAGTVHAQPGGPPSPRGQADPRLEATVDGVLFWGVFAVVLGVLGTLIGIVQAAQAIEIAGAVEARLAWGGIRVALTSTIFALVLFCVAAPTWFVLRKALNR